MLSSPSEVHKWGLGARLRQQPKAMSVRACTPGFRCWMTDRCAVERSNETVSLAILGGGYRRLRLQHRVDSTNCICQLHCPWMTRSVQGTSICNFCGNFKEKVIHDIALSRFRIAIYGSHVGGKGIARAGGRGASSSDERSCRSCCACRRCSHKIPLMGRTASPQFAAGQKLVLG